MELIVQREQLLQPLQALIGVTEKGQTLPVLANVKLLVKAEEIILTTTNLEIELSCALPYISSLTGGTTIPAKKLLDILKALPSGIDVHLTINPDKVEIKAGRSKFSLACLPLEEFPVLDHIDFTETLTLPKDRFRLLIQRVAYAMASADVRYFLNGMLLDVQSSEIAAVATDGHRLALSRYALESVTDISNQYIIPRKAIEELLKLVENEAAPMHLQLSANHLRVELGSMIFTTKLIEGKFPDYKRVIPPVGEKIIMADRVEMIESLMRTSILSQDKFRGIRMNISHCLIKLVAHNPEQEVAEEEVEVNYQGDDFMIAFNASYITDAFKNIEGDMVQLSFTENNSSCLIKNPEDDTVDHVVMPMRL